MQPLQKTLRSQLEATVKQARQLAESAAGAALEELGVGEASVPPHLSGPQRDLRKRLRAHGRQLGDALNGGKVQTMERLVEEVAYEHWHRMLFARFLAENDLLMYPDPSGPVAVSLEECGELAADEDAANGWELAARFAGQMLPQIFRTESPVFALKLPANYQVPLEKLLAALPAAVFSASDSLGWVYQFWQAENKERVNEEVKSGLKVGARELPAVTQLFTEPYMVSFLLDNALGAWWAARRLSEDDLRSASSEDELRAKAAIPGVPLEYLRFVRETDADAEGIERWTPAAGSFPGWPEHLSELKCLDPCCGSGHFLVSLLLMLTPLRMEMEGLDAQAAVDAVLRENLHGLELDQRCVELAAFALALTAWKYPDAGGYRPLPEIQVACSGLSVSVAKEEWKALAREGGLGGQNLVIAMDWLHGSFRDAPVLGSLLNPAKTEAAKIVQWDQLSAALNKALALDATDEQHEVAVVAQGLAKAASLLSGKYDFVSTNVPYLKRGSQPPVMVRFADRYYESSKQDIATLMISRWMESLTPGGMLAAVSMQSLLAKKGYTDLRQQLLLRHSWPFLARLGPGAFESISGEVVSVALYFISSQEPKADSSISILDLADLKSPDRINRALKSAPHGGEISFTPLSEILADPALRIRAGGVESGGTLSDFADALHGQGVGDGVCFYRKFWEIGRYGNEWSYYQLAPAESGHFCGREDIVLWENESGRMAALARSVRHLNHKAQQWRSGKPNWGKRGVVVSLVGRKRSTIYSGQIYGENCCVIVPPNQDHIKPIWKYVQSSAFPEDLARIDSGFAVSVKTILAVPFEPSKWSDHDVEFPMVDRPYSNDPTQWIFHGHPCGSVIWDDTTKWTAHGPLRTDDTVLHIAVARLLGYRWPAERDAQMELAAEQREWVNRAKALSAGTLTPGPSPGGRGEKLVDDDGIVCIPPVRGEASAETRLRDLLAAAFNCGGGDQWSNQTEARLLASVGHAGRSLESWLREKFFTQHCKLFGQRPFIWQIWDGLPDGFSVLLNYHTLDHKNLETLIYTYLGDWISRQKQDIASGIDGAQEKLAAAEVLKQRLELILEGEKPYDIFVRWKPLAEQPIGWNPDLNDGVRLNIRPFLSVPDIKKKGAGVLRDKPNIHWKKDRGKDVESAPWFHLGPQYGGQEGDRINDHHLSLAEKRAATEKNHA